MPHAFVTLDIAPTFFCTASQITIKTPVHITIEDLQLQL
jgi:hypothetical protein